MGCHFEAKNKRFSLIPRLISSYWRAGERAWERGYKRLRLRHVPIVLHSSNANVSYAFHALKKANNQERKIFSEKFERI